MFLSSRAAHSATALPLSSGAFRSLTVALLGLTVLVSPAARAQTAAPASHPATKATRTSTSCSGMAAHTQKAQEAGHRASVDIAVGSSSEDSAKGLGTLTGDSVSYTGKNQVAILTGDVILKLKDRTVTGDKAIYNSRSQTITLTGNVSVVSPQGDKITGSKVMLALKQGAEATTLEEGINAFPETQEASASPATPQSIGSAAASGL